MSRRKDISRRPAAVNSPLANVTGMPRMPKITQVTTGSQHMRKMKGVDFCDPAVKAWSDLVSDPFEAEFAGVIMPLAEDNIPCKIFPFRSYGSREVTILTGDTSCLIACATNPRYVQTPTDSGKTWRRMKFALGIDGFFGPALTPSDPTIASIGAAYQMSPTILGDLAVKSSLLTPVPFDPSAGQVLRMINNNDPSTGYDMRQSYYGIRVTFIGKLQDTEGFVEYINPYEPATEDEGASQNRFEAQRRDKSYRRRFFSSHRTHTFAFHPNCDSPKLAPVSGAGPIDAPTCSRQWVRVSGLREGDKILIEVVSGQEYVARPLVGVSQNFKVTPDAIAVGNAILSHHGDANENLEAKGGRKLPSLASHVVTHKILSHPFASRIAKTIANVTEGGLAANTVRQIAQNFIPKLPALLSDAELAIPLLAADRKSVV